MKRELFKKILTGVLAFALIISITACGDKATLESNNSGSGTTSNDKGSVTNPYSLGDSFEVTAYDIVPWTAYTPEGRQVEKPIRFRISNTQLLERQIYSKTEDGKKVEHDNYFLISFDIEILESSVSDTIEISDYLSLKNLNTNGQQNNQVLGSSAKIPDNYMYFHYQYVMPLQGAKWSFADVIITADDKDLAYVMFDYCGDDGEFHNVYIKVD